MAVLTSGNKPGSSLLAFSGTGRFELPPRCCTCNDRTVSPTVCLPKTRTGRRHKPPVLPLNYVPMMTAYFTDRRVIRTVFFRATVLRHPHECFPLYFRASAHSDRFRMTFALHRANWKRRESNSHIRINEKCLCLSTLITRRTNQAFFVKELFWQFI